MKDIFVHRFSGILSAVGMGLADVIEEDQEPCGLIYNKSNMNDYVNIRMNILIKNVVKKLQLAGFDESVISTEQYLNLRYEGTDTALMILKPVGKIP